MRCVLWVSVMYVQGTHNVPSPRVICVSICGLSLSMMYTPGTCSIPFPRMYLNVVHFESVYYILQVDTVYLPLGSMYLSMWSVHLIGMMYTPSTHTIPAMVNVSKGY